MCSEGVLVCGNSMFPTYQDGEIVSSKRFFDRKSLKIGDVVVVKFSKNFKLEGERVVIKRIAYITDNYIYLLGDNPSESYDSRYYGQVPISFVLCKLNDQRYHEINMEAI